MSTSASLLNGFQESPAVSSWFPLYRKLEAEATEGDGRLSVSKTRSCGSGGDRALGDPGDGGRAGEDDAAAACGETSS